MPPRRRVAAILAVVVSAALGTARADEPLRDQPEDPETWVDHDGQPIPPPKENDPDLYRTMYREGIRDPLSHAFDIPDKILGIAGAVGAKTRREAVNVNVWDEVPNSTWFTNRNHVRSLTAEEVRVGPGEEGLAPAFPWTIKSAKRQGVNPGFQIKDAKDRRWVVKLDAPGYPELGSGAEVVAGRLLYAAGYYVPYVVTVAFRREDLRIDPELLAGSDGEDPFSQELLDALLSRGARDESGHSYGVASLFLPGKPIGHLEWTGKRDDDPNDRFPHEHRRENRGLSVLTAWLNSWDLKDQQTLDMFTEAENETLGYLTHYMLDNGASLGAAAEGLRQPPRGFENRLDWQWMWFRLTSLGFVEEPWRHHSMESGIPSAGTIQARPYNPGDFRPLLPHPAFRFCTDRDAYWGAKLVASFRDDQIAAAIQAADYEDPRARSHLLQVLIARRDRTVRYWFDRVTPVDFFQVVHGELRFRDLAVDRGLEQPRSYRVRLHTRGEDSRRVTSTVAVPAVSLESWGEGATSAEIEIGIAGSRARPAHVDLEKGNDGGWRIIAVRHG